MRRMRILAPAAGLALLALASAACSTLTGAAIGAGTKFCPSCGAALTPARNQPATPQSYTPRHLAERILDSRTALEVLEGDFARTDAGPGRVRSL